MRLPETTQQIVSATSRCLRSELAGYRINYFTNGPYLDDIVRFYHPYYVLEPGSFANADLSVYVVVEGERKRPGPSVTDMRIYLQESKPVEADEEFCRFMRPVTEIEMITHPASRSVYIRGDDPSEMNLQVRVLVRDQLFRPIEQAGGTAVFHGAAVESGGKGVLFMGARNAGKTTSLLSLMAHQQCNFVSADRVKLRPHPEGVSVMGFPARCNIHRIAIENDPFLHPLQWKRQITYDHENKVLIAAKYLTELAGCTITPSAQLQTLVFVQLNPDQNILAVSKSRDPATVAALLRENLMEGGALDKHVAWLGLLPDHASTREQRLAAITQNILRYVRVVQVFASFSIYTAALRDRQLVFLQF